MTIRIIQSTIFPLNTSDLVEFEVFKTWQLSPHQNFLNNYNLLIMMRCDRQIKNSSELLHIGTITAPLGGVTEDRAGHLPGYNHIIIALLDGLGRVNEN